MLRLSKMADYGTVILAAMADEPQRSRSAAEIADTIRVPAPTVSKVLKILGRGGLVASQRGARGGYLLSRPPGEITLAEIILAMDGPIGMTECSVTPGLCTQESSCAVRANWLRINRAVFGVLREITLDQLSAPIPQPVDTSALARKIAPATKRK